jgi:hypothetical protein
LVRIDRACYIVSNACTWSFYIENIIPEIELSLSTASNKELAVEVVVADVALEAVEAFCIWGLPLNIPLSKKLSSNT